MRGFRLGEKDKILKLLATHLPMPINGLGYSQVRNRPYKRTKCFFALLINDLLVRSTT